MRIKRKVNRFTLAIALLAGTLSNGFSQSIMVSGDEWKNYGGDKGSSQYSSLSQIDSSNFKRLHIAWTWRSVEEDITRTHPEIKSWVWESTPLMIEGVLYISTSLSQVAAIDAATGKTKWVYDPETWKNGTPSNNGFVHRGVAYWKDGKDERILLGTGDGYLIALNAVTGKPIVTFGTGGRIDLTRGLGRTVERKLYGVSSAPIVCKDVVVVGTKVHDVPLTATMPPGAVRGFDVRTGKQVWKFNAIPQKGEFGNETWEGDSWKTVGSANVWAPISADDELGYVYLPFSTPSNDNYGGGRLGSGLFGESLVALDARTGKRIWHFQFVHHGLWDYDPPAAPNLIDINVNGKAIEAVAQVTKQGFVYVFDRVTGKPVWDIIERPVPQSTVPGEKSSPTQPFPSRPAAIDRQGITENDLVDYTPALRDLALAILRNYNYGPLFTPPTLEKPTILMPGIAGGASWAGAAFDPETGMFYVPSNTIPYAVTLEKSKTPQIGYDGKTVAVETLNGIPLWKPPYGRLTAIDMHTGDHKWMKPMGDLSTSVPALKQYALTPLGRSTRSHILLTRTLLFVAQEGSTQREEMGGGEAGEKSKSTELKFQVIDPAIVAYDKNTGKMIGKIDLPRNATAAPMTYMLNGKQYIAVATGGANLAPELIVLCVD
ncbi:pyrroloquinoline quinone-dependent dehydrogenase [Pedobacter antarcticus]|uniref:pyrroloquinoline quinone-dependent dehydrogenase n=1 Tax=Pedobacter antarcticus TaxID=34086 RepID=UPI00292F22DE|nr:pyrroloquinoline quinone-dependent dehydrogenase [Pedobacter antarcticus]